MRKRKMTRRKKRELLQICIMLLVFVIVIVTIIFIAKGLAAILRHHKVVEKQPEMEVALLTVNPYSRPQIPLEKVEGIVVHYTANPGASAMANRNYFEGLKDSHLTKASSHFIIGLDGEIVQCIPTAEISYASNDRNYNTISIECCHIDKTGEFNKKTYDSLVHLVAWLCGKFDLDTDDVIRHYDVTGKNCPKYYVEHEEEWEKFLKDIDKYIIKYGVEIK